MGSIPFKNRTRDDENFEKHPFLPNFTSGGTFRQQPGSNFIGLKILRGFGRAFFLCIAHSFLCKTGGKKGHVWMETG